jgi:uncharacterized protein YigE (DUF2233 family)
MTTQAIQTARALLLCTLFIAAPSIAAETPWKALGGGLELAEFPAGRASFVGDSMVTVLRIDPKLARFTMLSASQTGESPMPAKAWAAKHKLRAVINAGMFNPDGLPVGQMRIGGVEVNPTPGAQNSIFFFDPKTSALPNAQLLDRKCGDVTQSLSNYKSLLQSLRMIDCHGKVSWAKQAKQWSMAVLGADHAGRILFIHCRSPYPVRDFAELLQKLPLDLGPLMYLEGGPEATLYIKSANIEVEKIGSYETGFHEADDNHQAWDLPNVIGVLP